jgi:hypothetical protein
MPVLGFDPMNINDSIVEDAKQRDMLLLKLLIGELRVPEIKKGGIA